MSSVFFILQINNLDFEYACPRYLQIKQSSSSILRTFLFVGLIIPQGGSSLRFYIAASNKHTVLALTPFKTPSKVFDKKKWAYHVRVYRQLHAFLLIVFNHFNPKKSVLQRNNPSGASHLCSIDCHKIQHQSSTISPGDSQGHFYSPQNAVCGAI